MKDNLEAKFYNEVFESAKIESKNIEKISFKIDENIENPSNTDIVDCTKFYKESAKSKKSKNT